MLGSLFTSEYISYVLCELVGEMGEGGWMGGRHGEREEERADRR